MSERDDLVRKLRGLLESGRAAARDGDDDRAYQIAVEATLGAERLVELGVLSHPGELEALLREA